MVTQFEENCPLFTRYWRDISNNDPSLRRPSLKITSSYKFRPITPDDFGAYFVQCAGLTSRTDGMSSYVSRLHDNEKVINESVDQLACVIARFPKNSELCKITNDGSVPVTKEQYLEKTKKIQEKIQNELKENDVDELNQKIKDYVNLYSRRQSMTKKYGNMSDIVLTTIKSQIDAYRNKYNRIHREITEKVVSELSDEDQYVYNTSYSDYHHDYTQFNILRHKITELKNQNIDTKIEMEIMTWENAYADYYKCCIGNGQTLSVLEKIYFSQKNHLEYLLGMLHNHTKEVIFPCKCSAQAHTFSFKTMKCTLGKNVCLSVDIEKIPLGFITQDPKKFAQQFCEIFQFNTVTDEELEQLQMTPNGQIALTDQINDNNDNDDNYDEFEPV